DGQITGRGSPAIFGQQDRETARGPRRGIAGGYVETGRIEGTRAGGRQRQRRGQQDLLRAHRRYRRSSRVAAEYSNIWLVRSRGYEIDTSVISPEAFVTASSRGITNPV